MPASVRPPTPRPIQVDGHWVEVRINPRARRVSLKLDPADRRAVLTLPTARARAQGERFVRDRAGWLATQIARLPPAMPFVDGGPILFRGQSFHLVRRAGRGVPQIAGDPARLVIASTPEAFKTRTLAGLKALAGAAFADAVRRHEAALSLSPSALSIRDGKSRWGSCSSSGRIALSWRLVCAPVAVLDYVCAHEVAHRIEANHSPAFHAITAQLVENPLAARAWLRAHAGELFAVGAEV